MDLKTRAINMCTKPAAEWQVVAGEPHTVGGLIQGYAAPLSAIGAIAGLIGTMFLGTVLGGGVGGLFISICIAGFTWILALVGCYISAVIIEKLAPNFQSSGNTVQALKMVVFASTPVWLAGVFQIIPFLGSLVVLVAALYSIYVFYLGLTPVMKTPSSQVVPYMAVSAVVMIVIYFVFAMITGMLFGASMFMAAAS
jgi:hypothetical protein